MSWKSREALEKWLITFPLAVQQAFYGQQASHGCTCSSRSPVGMIVVDSQGQIYSKAEQG